MSERIEELILAYLHRGASPEEERELFEACRDNPEVAQLLRRNLVLSLKLHTLRDSVEVPRELHNSVISRINEIAAETAAEAPSTAPAPRRAPRFVFGWRHLAGTALAGAGLATALFFAVPRAPEAPATASVVTVRDTVLMTRVDTLVQTRTVTRTSGIARGAQKNNASETPNLAAPSGDTQIAQAAPSPAQNADVQNPGVQNADVQQARDAAGNDTGVNEMPPSVAESRVHEGAAYLEHYAAMLGTLEKVTLTSKDRIRD